MQGQRMLMAVFRMRPGTPGGGAGGELMERFTSETSLKFLLQLSALFFPSGSMDKIYKKVNYLINYSSFLFVCYLFFIPPPTSHTPQ